MQVDLNLELFGWMCNMGRVLIGWEGGAEELLFRTLAFVVFQRDSPIE